jgi:hypothetical protein
MKVKNTSQRNIHILTAHSKAGLPERLVIVAEATHEIDDAEWKKFAGKTTEGLIKNEILKVLEAPKLTEAEAKAAKEAEIAAAKKLLAESKAS